MLTRSLCGAAAGSAVWLATLAVASLGLAGCASTTGETTASARLEPTRGNSARGMVRFVQHGDMVRVSGTVSGLRAGAEHGFHVHEKGDCSSGDGNSAGGHFNPAGVPHGQHGSGQHHAGDLPNLRADGDGVATFNFVSRSIRIGDGATDIVGRGLIVHANPDDYITQPTGNAGARLACAVIAGR